MFNYFVTIALQIGEYNKITYVVVCAKNEYEARISALYSECHNIDSLIWDLENVTVKDGTMLYKIESISQINDHELRTLDDLGMYCFSMSKEELKAFKQFRFVEQSSEEEKEL